MNDISNSESLRDLQNHIWQMNIQRGFNTEDSSKKLVMLVEEVGELAKAIRKDIGLKFTDTTEQKDIKEELADVQIVLLGLASLMKVDMLDAVRAKEKKNQLRTWE
jgi:NTP pyrophosphatase (non-canonical NTP hydrolase)